MRKDSYAAVYPGGKAWLSHNAGTDWEELALKHMASTLVRGIKLMDGVRYCFVAFHENEQLEPGDTLIHTFVKPDWPVCETRWFYFIGTVQTEEQPSASPIFYLHHQPYYHIFSEPWTSDFVPAPSMVLVFSEEWSS